MDEPEETQGPDGPGLRRRSRAPGGRPHTIRVTLSDAEYDPIHAAAVKAGVSDASWLGEIGARMAFVPGATGPPRHWGEAMQAIMAVRAELMADRRVLRNVGGNLNDVARAGNVALVQAGADPGPEPEAGPAAAQAGLVAQTVRVLGIVERVVERVDQTVARLDGLMPTALAGRRRERRAERGTASGSS